MRKLLTICAVFVGLSSLAAATTVTGRLLDENCYHKHHNKQGCVAKASSERYLIAADNGSVYDLTIGSNDGVQRAMTSRAERANNPFPPPPGPVWVRANGNITDRGHLSIDKIEIR